MNLSNRIPCCQRSFGYIWPTIFAACCACGSSVTLAAISPAGDISPAYPGGGLDPWNVGGDLGVANHAAGSLTIDGGSGVSSQAGTIGSDVAATGTVTVTGVGSSWANTQDLFLGVFGTGTLKVLQGAHVDNQGASLGHIDGTGNVLVEGAGSQWTSRGDVFVGNGAKGTLTIDQQGAVHNHSAWIGLNTTSVGSVIVDGTKSKWEIDQMLTLGDSAGSGAATLSLTGAGSRVSIGVGAANDASQLPASETAVTVSDTGNLAKLAIYNGNKLQTGGNGYVGVGSGETGSVIVSGAGSAWSNSGNVAVGAAGTATLSLADGGAVSAGGVLSIGQHGTVTGNGTLTGNTTNSGLLAPGSSVGSLSIVGNYTQMSSGKSQFELGGTLPTAFDKVSVTGTASLSGALEVLLSSIGGNPFAPQLGNTFDVLTATGGVTGGFSTYMLPALSPGLMWNVHTGPLAVTLSVSVAGDYNHNGIVDAADYAIWRDTLGSTSDPRADGDSNGVVNAADYSVWKMNFGASGGAAANSASQLQSVPEPATASALLSLLAILAIYRARVASVFFRRVCC